MHMKTHPQYFISKRRRSSKVGITIGIDLGDIWSHYCTLSEDGEVVDRGRFRTNPSGVDKRFRDLGSARVAMEAGTHSIWVSEQIRELGHEVIVANVRELRAISHSDRKSDKVDAEKIARYARLDPEILRPIRASFVAQQKTLDSDPRSRRLSASPNGCGELGTRSSQALRVSACCLVHPDLCEALPSGVAARSGSSTWSSAPADRWD
jgi:hypothetical protein